MPSSPRVCRTFLEACNWKTQFGIQFGVLCGEPIETLRGESRRGELSGKELSNALNSVLVNVV